MAFQAGGAHALDRALEAIAYAYAEMTRAPGRRPSGRSRGQAATRCGWTRRSRGAARRRAGDRLQHLPDLELLARACSPRWSPATPVVVKPHPRAVLPLAITVQVAREVLAEAGFDPNLVSWPPSGPARAWPSALATAARGEAHRLHRLHRVRRLAGAQRPPGDGLHREGRRQHRRHRLHRRLQGHVPQPRLLAVPLQRPDVHHPAEPPHPAGRHRDRRGPQVLRRGRRRDRRPRSASCSATTRARSSCSAASSTTACSSGSSSLRDVRRCRARVAARSSTRRSRTPWCARRAGRELDAERRARPTGGSASGRSPSWSTTDRHRRVDRPVPRRTVSEQRRHDGRGLLDRRDGARRRRARPRSTPASPCPRTSPAGLRQPVGGVQRLPRHRRQPGRQRGVHRRRLRGEPVPRHSI